MKILYIFITSSCSKYTNGYFHSGVTIIDASRTWSTLQRKGFMKGFPTNIIISTQDMKIQYNAAGYSTSSTAAQIKSRLKSLLP